MNDINAVLETIKVALSHIKEVQDNVVTLNHESMHVLNDAIFEADVEIGEEGFVALQHQDILTQQLGATSELIEMISKHIDESHFHSLDNNIKASLDVAKAKKEAFSGNAFDQRHSEHLELF